MRNKITDIHGNVHYVIFTDDDGGHTVIYETENAEWFTRNKCSAHAVHRSCKDAAYRIRSSVSDVIQRECNKFSAE